MEEKKEYKVFSQALGPTYTMNFHKVYKAINKNTLRRLHNSGWKPEVVVTNGRFMTKKEAERFVALLNGKAAQRIEAQIKELQILHKKFLSTRLPME